MSKTCDLETVSTQALIDELSRRDELDTAAMQLIQGLDRATVQGLMIDAGIVTAATPEQIAKARAAISDDDTQIDEDALISEIEGGNSCWIQAWIYRRKD